MIARAAAVGCLLLALAVVNGAARDAWLAPRLGETAGRAVSSLLLVTLFAPLRTARSRGLPRPTSQAWGGRR